MTVRPREPELWHWTQGRSFNVVIAGFGMNRKWSAPWNRILCSQLILAGVSHFTASLGILNFEGCYRPVTGTVAKEKRVSWHPGELLHFLSQI